MAHYCLINMPGMGQKQFDYGFASVPEKRAIMTASSSDQRSPYISKSFCITSTEARLLIRDGDIIFFLIISIHTPTKVNAVHRIVSNAIIIKLSIFGS